MIPMASQSQAVCHMAGQTCAVLLHDSQTHRLKGGTRAKNNPSPLLLLPSNFFLVMGQLEKTSL